MTVQNLYTQYLDGKVTKAKFLYEVRRDQNLDMISHHNNFDDTIKILKNKSIISEKASKESTGKQEVDIIAKTIDMVNPYEYARGMKYELDMVDVPTRTDLTEDEVLKAQKKVLANLTKNSQFYFDKLNGKGEVSDEWVETTKKNIDAIGKGKAAKGLMREGIVDTENLKNVKLKNGKIYKNVKFHLPNDPKSFKTAEGGFMINQDIVNVVNADQELKEGLEPKKGDEIVWTAPPKEVSRLVRVMPGAKGEYLGRENGKEVVSFSGYNFYTSRGTFELTNQNKLREGYENEMSDRVIARKAINLYDKGKELYLQGKTQEAEKYRQQALQIADEVGMGEAEFSKYQNHIKEGYENDGLVKEDQQNAIFEKYAQATGIPIDNLRSMVRDAKEKKIKEHGQHFDRVADVNADSTPISEDIDLGHQDNEPHMVKGELYQIAKQATELYKIIDSVDNMGEIDFPHWWQAKIVLAKNYLEGAKDYLESALAVGNEDGEMSNDDELDEDIFKKGTQQVVASTPQSKAALKTSGYQQIPNTSDVTSISKG